MTEERIKELEEEWEATRQREDARCDDFCAAIAAEDAAEDALDAAITEAALCILDTHAEVTSLRNILNTLCAGAEYLRNRDMGGAVSSDITDNLRPTVSSTIKEILDRGVFCATAELDDVCLCNLDENPTIGITVEVSEELRKVFQTCLEKVDATIALEAECNVLDRAVRRLEDEIDQLKQSLK